MSAIIRRIARWPKLVLAVLALCVAVLAWQTWTAPPWRMDEVQRASGFDLVAADGSVFAHRGPHAPEDVDVKTLPGQVRDAFLAIEDRRFYSHGAIDYRGIARAVWDNARAGHVTAGGSTLTQQYVKNAYLSQDRTFTRKIKELFLADWAETWLGKDEILARYLQHAYFGDQSWGLVAASRHYFSKTPAQLTLPEAAMLAGLVKAPSRLAPTSDLPAASARMRVVLNAMADAGFITASQAMQARPPRLRVHADPNSDRAGWFADWVAGQLDAGHEGRVQTTLEPALQKRAEQVVARAPLGSAEVALIAMRPNGQVVALVGGKQWQPGAFNRAIRARRQPGSTFKLFDYLAAFRSGRGPDDMVLDAPVEVDGWSPRNASGAFRGEMTLRDAFARSSNTAAVRVSEAAGRRAVIKAASDLGIHAELKDDDPTVALGTASLSLTELAGAYAAFAGGRYPVVPHGLTNQDVIPPAALVQGREWTPMLDLLWHAANEGTGRRAALSQPTYGKTGTSQDGRDALFVGFAGDLVTLVWVGRDDNKPLPGSSGGHLPAEIWRAFMTGVPLGAAKLPYDPPEPGRQADNAGSEVTFADIYAGFERLAAGLAPVVQRYVPDARTVERYATEAAGAARYLPTPESVANGGATSEPRRHRKKRKHRD
ncbi:transglycosylase domain-containing protein [Parablastomonas sp. CN1-191]|uniref:transglycosylase domain-containing protein n=1 Tax=Parablastomonas sp. CN1-191 TaxID=3400908 RepID=UPI003BF8586B